MARGVTCAMCGRDLSEEPDALQVGETWFCSQGHLLDYEARPRHRRPGGDRLLGLGLVAVVIAAVAFAYLNGGHGARSAGRQGAWAGSLSLLSVVAEMPHRPHRVRITNSGLSVASSFLLALYVKRDCRDAMALADPSATAFISGCGAQLKTIEQNDFRLLRGSIKLDANCHHAVSVLWSTQCVSYEVVRRDPHTAPGYLYTVPFRERLVVYVWPYGDHWGVEGTAFRNSQLGGPYTNELQQLWKRTLTPTGTILPTPSVQAPTTLERTKVHLVSPFTAKGTLRALYVPTKSATGACYPGGVVGNRGVYRCRSSSEPKNCATQAPGIGIWGCFYDPCWPDHHAVGRLTMICLESPTLPNSSVRFTVTNQPRKARAIRSPLTFEPWQMEFRNGIICIAAARGDHQSAGATPTLGYLCGGGCEPYGRVNRERPVWTVNCALSGSQSKQRESKLVLTSAWFVDPRTP